MDFIRVTLIEEYKEGKISKLRRIPEHLLPVAGIKSIAQKLADHDLFTIEIIDSYKPIGEAKNSFFLILYIIYFLLQRYNILNCLLNSRRLTIFAVA